MKRYIAIFASLIAAVALSCSSADAHWKKRKIRPQVQTVEIGAGIISTVAFLAAIDWGRNHSSGVRWGAWGWTTAGCAVLSPVVAQIVLNGQLTAREFWSLEGSCVVPIVGGLVAEALYDATNPRPKHAHHRHHKKKKT